jgi:hypothetical protein
MTLKLKYQLNSILTVIFLSFFVTVNGQKVSRSFNFNQISETKFKTAFEKNFNAIFYKTIDSSRLEKLNNLLTKPIPNKKLNLPPMTCVNLQDA